MTKDEALIKLKALAEDGNDPAPAHIEADNILLALIDDPQITEAFNAVEKWYE